MNIFVEPDKRYKGQGIKQGKGERAKGKREEGKRVALANGPSLRAVLIVPILWSLVGSQAAFLLDVKPDLGLLVAAVAAVGLFIWPHRKHLIPSGRP